MFFRWIDPPTPEPLEIHVVLDNLSAQSAPPMAEWLAPPKRARWHLRFTPTSSSRLNLAEGWFAQLLNRRLKQGTFRNVDALVEAIDAWMSHWSGDPKPFVWTPPAQQIIQQVRRGRAALDHSTRLTHC